MTRSSVLLRGLSGAALLLVSLRSPVHAQTLFFNGLPNGVDALSSERETSVAQSSTYDDFLVGAGGWNVNGLFGYFVTDVVLWSQADYEIRRGITPGDGGSLVFSGTATASQDPTGVIDGNGETEYLANLSGLSFFLSPGSYWMSISVVGSGVGQAFVETTSGAGGTASLLNSDDFFNSVDFGANYVENIIGAYDFSYGVDGTAVVTSSVTPEPSTFVLVGLGLVGMGAASRRRRTVSTRRVG